ncbi:MAG: response regulator transcription factor [Xenococcaceae cyanobacterium MO_188.B32]|nr:response regulator transcription factor [Xenococcaceae cyanobacterium MO_188.B32]
MIYVLVVDDQNLVRQALQMNLEAESDLEVVGSADSGVQALEQIDLLNPDVVILDLEMPGIDGFTTLQIINQRFPQTKVLVLSSHEDQEYLNQAIQAGAKGYLQKNTPAAELTTAIRYIYKGYSQFGPGLLEKLVKGSGKLGETSEPEKLTKLEEKLEGNLVEIEKEFARRLLKLEKTFNSRGNEVQEGLFNDLKQTKNQVFKLRSDYKKLERQLSLLLISFIAAGALLIIGIMVFVFFGG